MLNVQVMEANLRANSIDSVDCPDNKFTGGILGDFNVMKVGDIFPIEKDFVVKNQIRMNGSVLTRPAQYIYVPVTNEATGDVVTAIKFFPSSIVRNLGVGKMENGKAVAVEDPNHPGQPLRVENTGEVVKYFKTCPNLDYAMKAMAKAGCKIKLVKLDHYDTLFNLRDEHGNVTSTIRHTPICQWEFATDARPEAYDYTKAATKVA